MFLHIELLSPFPSEVIPYIFLAGTATWVVISVSKVILDIGRKIRRLSDESNELG